MSDFNSYSTYIPEQENDKASPVLHRNNDQFHRSVVVNGVNTMESVNKNDSYNAGHVNEYPADDWRSTAKTATGGASATVIESGRVTINGTESTVLQFVKAGVLEKDAEGNYRMAGVEQPEALSADQLAADRQHDAVLPAETVAIVNSALEGLSDSGVETVTQYGIAMALGRLTPEMLVRQVSTLSGTDMAESQARTDTVRQVYQKQADNYIVSRLGLHQDDLPGFYEFARGSQNRDALSKAVNSQIYSSRMDGYKGLVQLYLNTSGRSSDALQEHGFETKTTPDGKEMVKIHGQWMATKVAAFNGWI